MEFKENEDLIDSCPILKEFLKNIHELSALNSSYLQYACDIIWLEIASLFRVKIVPKFWSYFKQHSADKEVSLNLKDEDFEQQNNLFEGFVCVVSELKSSYQYIHQTLNKFMKGIDQNVSEQSLYKRLNEILHTILIAQLPPNFQHVIYVFYNISIRVFFNIRQQAVTSDKSGGDDKDLSNICPTDLCKGCKILKTSCKCHELLHKIDDTNVKLLQMDLLDRLAGQAMTTLIEKRIKDHIHQTCHGIFDKSHLKALLIWLDGTAIFWLKRIFRAKYLTGNQGQLQSTVDAIQSLSVKLTFYVYESYALSIIEQFFNIIIDFPDSIPAIEDLKICMEKMNLRQKVIVLLKSCLEARILHPGVNTMDILTGYVAAIKAIRYLDNTGIILETVTAPIKEYLRKRSDTVRCVVTSLTEEGPFDLSEELKGDIKGNQCSELSEWEIWEPEPVGLEPLLKPASSIKMVRSADVISMVVDIYGSKELFMSEYRNLLGARLLTQLSFNPEKEIRNLELLKLRFGDALLHNCEVMLKDVADSKRINNHIHNDPQYLGSKYFEVSCLIVSGQFWPLFSKESMELPEDISNEFKKFTKSYEAYKGNRTLNWRTIAGRVTIIIELGSRILEMTVPPIQAVIIYHFQKRTEWSLEDLSSTVKIPPTMLKRRMCFWQSQGIIVETSGAYKLVEKDTPYLKMDKLPSCDIVEDEENDSAMASSSDQREEELQVFWSYIVGMLTNLDSMTVERIHQMLRLFASNGMGVEFSQEELKYFLQRKVREHKLLYSNGVYQLAK